MGFGVDAKFHLMPIAKLPIDIALFRISHVYQSFYVSFTAYCQITRDTTWFRISSDYQVCTLTSCFFHLCCILVSSIAFNGSSKSTNLAGTFSFLLLLFFYGDICCLKVKSATSVTAHAPGAWKAKPPAFKNDSRA